jgi:3-isopropylmalate/(R)-2-methylmalate dehydratase small subunit
MTIQKIIRGCSIMKYTGRVWKFGDNVDTDQIIPARYLNSSDAKFLASHVMEDANRDFAGKVRSGDIIVGGENFGCGSSREHAPIAIKAAGVSCVVAKSFARIFYRNAFNMGLPIFESRELYDEVRDGQEIAVDGDEGWIRSTGGSAEPLKIQPIPPFMQELINAGGLMPYLTKK